MEVAGAQHLVHRAHAEGLIDDFERTAVLELLDKRGVEEVERWLSERLPPLRLLTLKSQAEGATPSPKAVQPPAPTAVVFAGNSAQAAAARPAPATVCDDDSEDDLAPIPTIPHYRFLHEIGRGSAGVVFLAEDVRLRRQVAVKIVRREGWDFENHDVRRFRGEAETLARLRHPNIVQVYEVGESRGAPYLAIEYLPGGSLADLIRGARPTPKQAARMVEDLARAAAFAHRAGVVHRDLKPANILLDRSAAGAPGAKIDLYEKTTPKISDFGIAKRENSGDRTATGMILGTPQYMAPEQANGHTHEIGPATDVYGLGGVLYEMLTGQPPFQGGSAAAILHQVVMTDVVDPQQFSADIPLDLATICLKCLAKDPKRRYHTADDLADDLERFRTGVAVRARPPSFVEKTWRTLKRRPAAALAALLFLLIWTVGFPLTFWMWRSAESAKHVAQRQADDTQHALAVSHIAQAYNAWNNDDVAGALQFLERCPEHSRRWAWRYVNGLCRYNATTVAVDRGWIKSVDFSPDGRLLAVGSGTSPMQNNPDPPGHLSVFDAETRTRLFDMEYPKNVRRVRFSPSGNRILVHYANTLEVVDVAERRVVRELVAASDWGFSMSRNGGWAAMRPTEKGILHLYDVERDALRPLPASQAPKDGAVFLSAKGAWLCCHDRPNRRMTVFDSTSGATLSSWAEAPGDMPVHACTDEKSERWIDYPSRNAVQRIAAHGGKVAKSWSCVGVPYSGTHGDTFLLVSDAEQCHAIDTVADAVRYLPAPPVLQRHFVFSPNGAWVAEQSTSALVRIWDASNGRLLRTLRGHRQPVHAVAFHPNGDLLASGDQDGVVRLCDLRHDRSMAWVDNSLGWGDGVQSAGLVHAGDRLLALFGEAIRTFDAASMTPLATDRIERFLSGRYPATESAFSADGSRLVVVRKNPTTKIVVLDSTKPVETLAVHELEGEANVRIVAATPDMKYVFWATLEKLADGSPKSVVYRWDWQGGGIARTDFPFVVPGMTTNGAGTELFLSLSLGFHDCRIACWKIDPWTEKWRTEKHDAYYPVLKLSPDGETLAAANFTGHMVNLLDADTGAWGRALPGPRSCCGVAFSPDGKELASIGYDGHVLLWDLRSGLLELTLKQERIARPEDWGSNCRLAFSPDGKRLSATHWIGSIATWSVADAEPEPLRGAAKEHWVLRHALQPHAEPTFVKHYLRQLGQDEPQHPVAAGLYARTLLLRGERARATAIYERLAAAQPWNFDWQINAALCAPLDARRPLRKDLHCLPPDAATTMEALYRLFVSQDADALARYRRTQPKLMEGWNHVFDLGLGVRDRDPDRIAKAAKPLLSGPPTFVAFAHAAMALTHAQAGDRAEFLQYRAAYRDSVRAAHAEGYRRQGYDFAVECLAEDYLAAAEALQKTP